MFRKYRLYAFVIAPIFAITAAVSAAPGDLDPSFGTGGIVDPEIGGFSVGARAVLVQPDGKILVSGRLYDDADNTIAFFLSRYYPNGTADASFGAEGKIVDYTNVGAGEDIGLQADGKIVSISSFDGGYVWAVRRYTVYGAPDPSFGDDGLVITPFENGSGYAGSVAVQADGKIVVAGVSALNSSSYYDCTVIRYNPDGSLDESFNGSGKVVTSFGEGGFYASAVLLQPDGKIVAVGGTGNGTFALARFNSDGSLDPGFGVGGRVVHEISNIGVDDAVLQPDGKIVVSGWGYSVSVGQYSSAIVRCDPDGSIDTSFATNGVFTTDNNFVIGTRITVQPDGKLIGFGFVTNGPGNSSFALERLEPIGTPDASFGIDGRVITTNYSGVADGVVQSDGKILAAGGSYAWDRFPMVRYLGDPSVSRPAEFDFDGDGRSDISVFRPAEATWYLDRSTEGFYAAQFGLPTDRITPADFDGDGKTDIAVYRPSAGSWYWLDSSDGAFQGVQFGTSQDLPTEADYDGDGRADVSVFRPSTATWYRQNSSDGSYFGRQFGLSEDRPAVGDYDGDGKADLAVFRPFPGVWYWINSSDGSMRGEQFGTGEDGIVPGDYDGDGRTDLAVYSWSNNYWYIHYSSGAFTQLKFGLDDDLPTPGDFDGDGRTDISVFRRTDGNWYRINSSNGSFSAYHFGTFGDIPTESAFLLLF